MSTIDGGLNTTNLLIAQTHVYNVCNNGLDIILVKSSTKDSFGETLTESTLSLKAFPIRFTPFDRDVLNRISWAENVDMLCYVSKKAIDNLSLTRDRLKQYKKIRYAGKTYEMRYVDFFDAFADDFLYIVFGAKV